MIPSSFRRVVPVGYQMAEMHLDGQTPLLMSSGEADRDSETYRAFRALSKKRGKTTEDEERLRELEWYTRLYFDRELGPYIPGKNAKELLRSAATKWREGENVKRSLVVPDYRVPLLYDGPRTADELWQRGFRYTTMVANAGAGSGRVERCRPCFDQWAITCELAWDPEDLDGDTVAMVVERSQKYGLGDYRPEFGAFVATLTMKGVKRGDANASAVKPRNGRAMRANEAHAGRIKA